MATPVWQTGNALQFQINAGQNLTINIGNLVSNAQSLEERYGMQFRWMHFDESTHILTLTNAPQVPETTPIRIGFMAKGTTGEKDGEITITLNASRFTKLHNFLFFEEMKGYGEGENVTQYGTTTPVTEITDNDYKTFSTLTDFNIDIADDENNPTQVDYIFIKAKGSNITYSVTPTGGSGSGVTDRQMPTTVQDINGRNIRTEANGFTHDLFPFETPFTATDVRLQITGTNLQVTAVMLLKVGWELEANKSDVLKIDTEKVDRTGHISEAGRFLERVQVLNAERYKWEHTFQVIFKGTDVDEWMDWVEKNTNCILAKAFTANPAEVYPVTFPALEMPNGYLGLVKAAGETIEFGVYEQ